MNSKSVLLAFVLFAASTQAQTQAQAQNIPVPASLNEVQYLNRTANSLAPLEKGKADYKSKTKAMGFGGVAFNYELPGDKSPVRVLAKDSIVFVVSMADGTGDPTAWYSLFRVTVKKGVRIANYTNAKTYFGKNGGGDGIVELATRKIGANGFAITPAVKLQPGEYLFVNKGTLATCFAFGVD